MTHPGVAKSPRRLSRLAAVAVGLVAAMAITACGSSGDGSSSSGPAKVAVIGPFSGSAAQIGSDIRNGANLALSQSSGRVDGRKVSLESFDDQCAPDGGVKAANKIIDGYTAVLGPACSSSAFPVGPILQKAGLVHLTGGWPAELTERGDELQFRTLLNDRVMMQALAKLLEEKGIADRVAIAADNSYGVRTAEVLSAELEKLGAPKPVVTASYEIGGSDYSGQVQAIKQADPTALVVISFDYAAAPFVKQARQLGYTGPILSHAAGTDLFGQIAGSSANGVEFVSRYVSGDPVRAAFTRAYEQKYGNPPSEDAVTGYFGMQALLLAMRDAGAGASSDELRDALHALDAQSDVGPIRFDRQGDPVDLPILIGEWKNGKPVIDTSEQGA